MPRNFVSVSGTVNIDGAPRQKNIAIFNYGNKIVPADTALSSVTDGSWSKYLLKEREGFLLGVAFSDYGKVWAANRATTLGQRITPKVPNNHWYECTAAGTTGATEPSWATGGDFTVEAWIKPASVQNQVVMSKCGPTFQGFACMINDSGSIVFRNNSTDYVSPPGSIATGTWQHVAWTMSGTTLRAHVNGVEKLSVNITLSANTFAVCVGAGNFNGTPSSFFDGYIDSFRITKGFARYTSNFPVPTTDFSESQSDARVSSILTFDSFPVTDLKPLSWTLYGSGGVRAFDYKFGGSSFYCPGDTYVSTPHAPSIDLVSNIGFNDGTVVWTDRGLMETPITRGPFPVEEPGPADPNAIFLARHHELYGRDEVTGAGSINTGNITVVSGTFPNTNSLNFDGSTNTGLFYPAVSPGSGDWGIECWFWMNAISPGTAVPLVYVGDLGSNNHRLQIDLTANNGVEGFVSIGMNGGTASFGSSGPISAGSLVTANNWNHIVFEKFENNTYLYLNGVQVATAAHNAGFWFNPATTAATYIGTGRVSNVVRYTNCRVGEVRISNVSRYSGAASYTVPTAPYVV